jgi:energy-coupling factor transporter ATP-binding protein EcfA2
MPDFPYHRQLRLKNFTVFAEATFEFVPGVNACIGENGSGKTHLLKAMYAYQRPPTRDIVSMFRRGRRNGTDYREVVLAELLGGKLEQDERGRFYLNTPIGRQPMPMVAEGLRRIAALVRL